LRANAVDEGVAMIAARRLDKIAFLILAARKT
jgi:hypothetical protein